MYLSLSPPLPPRMSGCPLGRGGAMRRVTFQTIWLSKPDLQVQNRLYPTHAQSFQSRYVKEYIHGEKTTQQVRAKQLS